MSLKTYDKPPKLLGKKKPNMAHTLNWVSLTP